MSESLHSPSSTSSLSYLSEWASGVTQNARNAVFSTFSQLPPQLTMAMPSSEGPESEPASSSEMSNSSIVPSISRLSTSLSRPMRAARAKKPSLTTDFVDPSNLTFDDDDDESEEDESMRVAKKPRLSSYFVREGSSDEDDSEFEIRSDTTSVAESSNGSTRRPSSPELELEPMPWELSYYPQTHQAVRHFRALIGTPPPETDNLQVAQQALVDRLCYNSFRVASPEPKSMIVKLSLPPGTVDKNADFDPCKVGFMDFPGEIRNQVYFLVFNDTKPINFRTRSGLARSAALLRINKTVYKEAREVLYGGNRFVFEPCNMKTGRYWIETWTEVGYSHIRQFLVDIGPINTGLIKTLTLRFEDASPSGLPHSTVDQRRFEHNGDLYWILKCLARQGKIEDLTLEFAGRRTFGFHKGESVFLYAIAGIKTDRLVCIDTRANFYGSWRSSSAKTAQEMKDVFQRIMVRPVPLKELDFVIEPYP